MSVYRIKGFMTMKVFVVVCDYVLRDSVENEGVEGYYLVPVIRCSPDIDTKRRYDLNGIRDLV